MSKFVRSIALPNVLAHIRGSKHLRPLTLSSAVLPAQAKKMSRIGLRGDPCSTPLLRTSVDTITPKIVVAAFQRRLHSPYGTSC